MKGGYTRELVDVFTKEAPHQPTIVGVLNRLSSLSLSLSFNLIVRTLRGVVACACWLQALLYRATEDNPEFLGRAPVAQLAAQIYKSVGKPTP
jgi:hypothetical protein